MQDDHGTPSGGSLHRPHAIDIHDCGAVDPDEPIGIQGSRQPAHRLAKEVRASPDVKARVVIVGLDPVADLLEGLVQRGVVQRRAVDHRRQAAMLVGDAGQPGTGATLTAEAGELSCVRADSSDFTLLLAPEPIVSGRVKTKVKGGLVVSQTVIAYPDGVADHVAIVRYKDQPGMLGRLGTALGDAGINIATMDVGRPSRPNSNRCSPCHVAVMRALCLVRNDCPCGHVGVGRSFPARQ